MLAIKSTPSHKFSVFVEIADNIDPEWCIGRIDQDGNFIEAEVECTIDGTKALIKIHDYFKETYYKLPLLNFIIKLVYGFDSKTFMKLLAKKYGNKINGNTQITIILYELLEIA